MFTAQLSASFMFLALLGNLGQAQVIDPNCARQYTVQQGDFCNSISAARNVSTFQLAHVNSGLINSDCSNLFSGETLCLGIIGQDCNITHVVEAGDTCLAIAAVAGTDFATLIANNRNLDGACTNIFPGEVLCTDKIIYPYSTT